MSKILLLFSLMCLFTGTLRATESPIRLCEDSSQVFSLQKIDPPLNEAEKRWICGDPDRPGYQSPPLYQVKMHLKAFMQARAYLNASYTLDEGRLIVDPGKKLRAKTLSIDGDAEKMEIPEEEWKGQLVNPSLLDRLEKRAEIFLKNRSFPCPEIKISAQGEDLSLNYISGPSIQMSRLRVEEVKGIKAVSLERFRPFTPDSPYNLEKIQLYEKRLLRAAIVQNTFFRRHCEGKNTWIEQEFMESPPRQLRFGLGFDTEQGPYGQVSWEHLRFGSMASQIHALTQASLENQKAEFRSELFYFESQPRFSVEPRIALEHQNLDDFREINFNVELGFYRSLDIKNSSFRLGAGPAFNNHWYRMKFDSFYLRDSSIDLFSSIDWKSHRYESYDSLPARGYRHQLFLLWRDPSFGARDRSLKIAADSRILKLPNICPTSTCVEALRFGVVLTLSDAEQLNTLPPSLKSYIGGLNSVRGFRSHSLPRNNGKGALTSVYSGFELRSAKSLWDIFPYLFIDAAKMGERTFNLDPTLYWATGAGLRWFSPIGLMQGYIAKPSHSLLFAFFSFGGEF